ncbi:MAG: hypothetical protein KatS3mg076_0398 [Candidatus Binatia bacterium]|nr:MAG: hypothetical protein KatS3mg076_0398 [Candidatus Binatia bacterium]
MSPKRGTSRAGVAGKSRAATSRGGQIRLRRVYDPPERDEGPCYLVDGLWPRGIGKARLRIEGWLRDVAPSPSLRAWFRHDPERWPEFRARYFAELERKPEAWKPLLEAARRGPVTLLYAASDREHNNAVALREFLEAKLRMRRSSRRTRSTPRASDRASS